MSNTGGMAPGLMLYTLIVVLVLLVVALLWFRRKRSNRHPMEGIRERNMDEIKAGKPPRPER